MSTLVVFHYHLLPGGVTEVIKKSSAAILSRLPEVERIELVTGRPDNAEAVAAEIRKAVPASRAHDISLTVLPEIDYTERGATGDWRRIAALLRNRWADPDNVLWAHNYHIGKNPAFTRSITETVRSDPSRGIVLQIHDFPESSRYGNLRALRRTAGTALYPISPGVRYAVINERDRRMLAAAGMPEELVVPLPNPVSVPELPVLGAERMAAVRDAMASVAARFLPEAPLLIYPVRTIRRKNVLEAAMLAAASDPPLNLLVTLPGVSGPEKPYSDLVERAFRNSLVPGVWGPDITPRINYREAVATSDLIVSSSVQEGFGYLFAESAAWRKPLVARSLEVADQFAPIFDGYPASFYERFLVPLSRRLRRETIAAYRRKFASLRAMLPAEYLAEAQAGILSLLEQDAADFSYLSAEEQLRMLGELRTGTVAGEIRDLNRRIFTDLRRLTEHDAADGSRVDRLFGPDAYAGRVRALLSGLRSAVSVRSDLPDIQERLIAAFAGPEELRLLLG